MASGGPRVPGAGVVRVRPLWTFRPTPGRSTRRPGADRGRSRARCARRPAGQLHTGRHQRGERLGRGHLPLDGDVGVRHAAVPAAASGSRASRVHSTTLMESGSPEATPRWNGYLPPVRAGAVAPTPPQRPRPGHRARSCAAAGVPSPAQHGRHPEQRSRMRDDHAGKLVHPDLIRTGASCRRTSAPNRVT
jgi:hypothetical protein